MPNLKKINPSELQLGMMFSMPVFFDDGKYMFLAKNRTVKKYHLNAVHQWKIPFCSLSQNISLGLSGRRWSPDSPRIYVHSAPH